MLGGHGGKPLDCEEAGTVDAGRVRAGDEITQGRTLKLRVQGKGESSGISRSALRATVIMREISHLCRSLGGPESCRGRLVIS
jgi:hypothetical protein